MIIKLSICSNEPFTLFTPFFLLATYNKLLFGPRKLFMAVWSYFFILFQLLHRSCTAYTQLTHMYHGTVVSVGFFYVIFIYMHGNMHIVIFVVVGVDVPGLLFGRCVRAQTQESLCYSEKNILLKQHTISFNTYYHTDTHAKTTGYNETTIRKKCHTH